MQQSAEQGGRRAERNIVAQSWHNIVAHNMHRSAPRNALQKLASDLPGAVALQIRALSCGV